jgi:formate hydrogenlyase subunit 4
MQGRVGPPIVQPFYDFVKLYSKEKVATTRESLVWVWSYLVLTVTAFLLFFAGQDLLLVVFVLAFAGASLALGAFSVKSPYAQFGAHREILQMFSYEPILILATVAIFLKTGTFLVRDVVTASEPLLPDIPLVFLALLIALGIKMRKSPFDVAACEHAHQEIVRGVYTEYSGPFLALVELTHWYELVLVLGLVALLWAQPLWVGVVIALAVYFLELVIDNIAARLRWSWMVSVSWALGAGFILLNILVLQFTGKIVQL